MVQLCMSHKEISYHQISEACGLNSSNIEEAEAVVMDCFTKQLIECRIDQRNKIVQVLNVFPRDVKPENIAGLINDLKNWESNNLVECQKVFEEKVRSYLDTSIKDSYNEQVAIQAQID